MPVASDACQVPSRVPAALIEGRSLTKRFGDFVAVDGIDFRVEPGEAFGFLGPNGAGKTSTMRMICVHVARDRAASCACSAWTRPPTAPRIRARLGVVPQEDNLDLELTVRENLLIYGRYFGLPRAVIRERADELLDFVQLTDRSKDRVDDLSGGMKRRLTIARALVNEPDLVLLDEPTTGLDPQARHLVWERLYRLKRQRRDARAHHALHGRGRAALRPARDHGRRRDRRRGLARAS